MKLLLCLVLYCTLVEGHRNYLREDNCLKLNKYMHESFCRGLPRRYFYAFHRVISDCVLVTTNCPRIHKHNEYANIQDCRDDCWFFIDLDNPTTTTDANTDKDNDNDKDKSKDKGKGKS